MNLYKSLGKLGERIQNVAYLLQNSDYQFVRKSGGDKNMYKLLNKPWFHQLKINTVLDIGANEGQFLRTIKTILPDAELHCFEPNPVVFEKLQSNQFTKIFFHQLACGKEEGRIKFNVSGFSPASSILEFNEQLSKDFPGSTKEKEVEVKVVMLDSFLKQKQKTPYLIKLDVQGYELNVLKGAVALLQETAVVVCEIINIDLYKGQSTYSEIIQFLSENNFRIIDIAEPIRNQKTQEMIYTDIAFINNKFV